MHFATLRFWASSQRPFVWRKPTTPRNKGLGQPRLQAGAALLGSRLFPGNPYQAFSFKTLSKILCSLGTAQHSMALEPDPPLHYSAGHSSREWLYSNSWETERKAMGGHWMTRITSFTQFATAGSSPAAGCRSQTLTEEDYFEI